MNTDVFASRHIGISEKDRSDMLEVIGVDSVDTLIDQTIPQEIRLRKPLDLASPLSEFEFQRHIHDLAKKNQVYKTYIGLGYHQSITPAVIQRNILENPGWYTAYTPYQAEIAQGRLEALINFQTMVCDLTGMPLANASLLDEATAAAEAMTMLFDLRSREQKKNEVLGFFVSEDVLPQTLDVLKTRARPLGITLEVGNHETQHLKDSYFGALLQYPGKHGSLSDIRFFCSQASESGIKVAVAADILSLVVLTPPGEMGADVVVGTTQRFGIPLGYGGPHAAFFATREEYKRNIPGRIIGVTRDQDGRTAYRMALQTREQHIKRDKATSNICTAQVLLAVMSGAYGVYHGPAGLKHIAQKVHRYTSMLNEALASLVIPQYNQHFFDTLKIGIDTKALRTEAESRSVNFLYIDADTAGISIHEACTDTDIQEIIDILAAVSGKESIALASLNIESGIPESLVRTSEFMENEVFHSYHSETEMMRYLKRLEKRDLALNHSMISLGSCTMKLNAASEMLPLSDPRWGNIHPFVPIEQAGGYHDILYALAQDLSEITGFAGTSLQPNSGAQGEYAGLMVIRAYHEANGQGHRDVCVIPASAHGTNPASAVMAGMKVVVIKTDDKGNIDIDDFKVKIEQYSERLAALMVTYPSTHGVFESSIKEITGLVHQHGGQVYMDGANMNAQVGLTTPALIGADVCHLNLHKTFAIPHGGGGPGVGPICVAPQLLPFLPGNPVIETGGKEPISAISAAPWGSALACLISYAYIRMLGAEGLTRATEIAICSTNYLKEKLQKYYNILYTGEKGRAAHEMIVDCRPFRAFNIEVTDIAKRLMDYGFHAPTVSFPVAGTLMIEPTESESLAELDRFCQAMLNIYEEIVQENHREGESILKNAPHTLAMLTADTWPYSYTRQRAAFPAAYVEAQKFWPAVRRVDEAYGDRNLMCTCPPLEFFEDSL